jgi:hypothetical protein
MSLKSKLQILIAILAAHSAVAWAGPSPGELLEDPGIRLERDADRERIVREMAALENQRRTDARERATRVGLPQSGGTDTLRVRIPLATGDPSRHFIRLRFSSP